MKRNALDDLIRWNKPGCDKPVLLAGGKGVGKTFLAYDFAKAFFEDIYYINLEQERGVCELFDLQQTSDFIGNLYNYLGTSKERAQKGILILDEVTNYPSAVKWLIPLQKQGAFNRVIAIADCFLDNIKDALFKGLKIINIYPLQFDEFLLAISSDWYLDSIKTHFESNKPLPDIVHKELLNLFELYLHIGGMPQAVNEYISMTSAINVPIQHKNQYSVFCNYIYESNNESLALKMQQVLDSIPMQLLKDNRKFQYKLIRKGTTHAMYKDAIAELSKSGLVLECFKVYENLFSQLHTSPKDIDMSAVREGAGTSFKLYYPDTGLLYSALAKGSHENVSSPAFETGSNETVSLQVRKAVLEQYVAQTLRSNGYPLLFWESESMAKIDFLLPANIGIIPVEIHDSTNTRSKSINVFEKKVDSPFAIKISPRNFEYSGRIKYVPNYAVFCI